MKRSWPTVHAKQPLAGRASTALCSSSADTWSGASPGEVAMSIAAAAVTCGVAKLVPSAERYSSGPQLE